ncbi:CHORD protein [Toxoplasma gondii TgCatPRC2]|uniref:CHORD protein n=17 Tax=Toxoplasma gondii TaxID=5811 RepID=A0A0F7UTM9_TOXGV|nr:CHORD protein [Toxoplasma gondii ME49]AAF18434.1 Rar1 [Toxoplasma gondii]EPR58178.1 CHORD protein [Toxoplasma gondii GT1]ESS29759.1 CHORD protein [Toxoplasma gondii VEG]KFG43509.1 CHORD protein [Toxoplasma gondii FOU]KFG58740.1 CHORD protein [Toxoplasma gondii RUB]KYF39364.1 CHORD protein [Toxoplasma gondii ARI]KYK66809.1 CHORD protein [Toxoplasma gondii TgCatPRC2]PIL95868.1 CHORD protein [Toxoplasma gondii COUG]PUA88534.1 CHORD protein [Toxoplasma gondii TgCATBr9]RQX67581.1 CHORD prot|eukprot:XP_002369871.1 CHORD protein [Toxoplasma gondii ME49]
MQKKCTRPGCGKSYKETENEEGSCVYHAAMPIFHDGVKRWPCCDAEAWDWTDFMAIKGCSFGKHTDVKPTSPPPTAAATPAPTQPAVVKDIEEFNKRQKEEEEAKKRQKEAEAAKPQTPLVTPEGNYKCSNKGCNKEYSPNDNSPTACKFHPGQPVFRDCMKSWTCCQAKSYDWDEFMKIEPCQTGPHVPKMFCQS